MHKYILMACAVGAMAMPAQRPEPMPPPTPRLMKAMDDKNVSLSNLNITFANANATLTGLNLTLHDVERAILESSADGGDAADEAISRAMIDAGSDSDAAMGVANKAQMDAAMPTDVDTDTDSDFNFDSDFSSDSDSDSDSQRVSNTESNSVSGNTRQASQDGSTIFSRPVANEENMEMDTDNSESDMEAGDMDDAEMETAEPQMMLAMEEGEQDIDAESASDDMSGMSMRPETVQMVREDVCESRMERRQMSEGFQDEVREAVMSCIKGFTNGTAPAGFSTVEECISSAIGDALTSAVDEAADAPMQRRQEGEEGTQEDMNADQDAQADDEEAQQQEMSTADIALSTVRECFEQDNASEGGREFFEECFSTILEKLEGASERSLTRRHTQLIYRRQTNSTIGEPADLAESILDTIFGCFSQDNVGPSLPFFEECFGSALGTDSSAAKRSNYVRREISSSAGQDGSSLGEAAVGVVQGCMSQENAGKGVEFFAECFADALEMVNPPQRRQLNDTVSIASQVKESIRDCMREQDFGAGGGSLFGGCLSGIASQTISSIRDRTMQRLTGFGFKKERRQELADEEFNDALSFELQKCMEGATPEGAPVFEACLELALQTVKGMPTSTEAAEPAESDEGAAMERRQKTEQQIGQQPEQQAEQQELQELVQELTRTCIEDSVAEIGRLNFMNCVIDATKDARTQLGITNPIHSRQETGSKDQTRIDGVLNQTLSECLERPSTGKTVTVQDCVNEAVKKAEAARKSS